MEEKKQTNQSQPETDASDAKSLPMRYIRQPYPISAIQADLSTQQIRILVGMMQSIQDGVQKIDLLRTRQFGNKIYIDLEISVKRDISLIDAHEIAENVHDAVEQNFPKVKHVMIHVNPGEE